MAKVKIKIPDWVGINGDSNLGWTLFEREIAAGTSLEKLLLELADSYPNFRKMLYNPEAGKPSEQIDIVLNDTFLQVQDYLLHHL